MTTQKPKFDIDAALKGLREGKDLTGQLNTITVQPELTVAL